MSPTPPTSAEPGLIDVHAHFVTDQYVTTALEKGLNRPDGMPGWPSWNVDDNLRLMDATGVERSILSISSPGVHFGDDAQARALALHVNQFAGDISRLHPDRFGFFAALPVPDIDGALEQVALAAEMGASGYVVESSPRGVYLSNPRYDPLWAALDEQQAVVFVHPTSPPGTELVDQGLPRPMLEFLFDTTRTFAGLIAAGVLDRFPGIRWIVPHSGAVLPLLADRMQFIFGIMEQTQPEFTAPDVHESLRKLWFDVAGFPVPGQLPLLTDIVGTEQIVYGSDSGATGLAVVQRHVEMLGELADLSVPDWRGTFARNATRLLSAPARA